ncbi:MAG: hypothetical protein IH934_07545 [Nanoarchaeota archaeon]|nr:hypothetical protein [Nanoarchaeota archaeon]
MIQRTYILDTNVYGEILIDPNSDELARKIRRNKSFLIYGVDLVERELSETPLHMRYKGSITRRLLIELFESLSDEIIIVGPLAEHLAEDYFKKYKELSKSGKYKIVKERYDEKSLKTDFEIIAVASLKGVDVVVSSDKRTLLSQLAKDVYAHINSIDGLRTPELIEYKKFKEVYLR